MTTRKGRAGCRERTRRRQAASSGPATEEPVTTAISSIWRVLSTSRSREPAAPRSQRQFMSRETLPPGLTSERDFSRKYADRSTPGWYAA